VVQVTTAKYNPEIKSISNAYQDPKAPTRMTKRREERMADSFHQEKPGLLVTSKPFSSNFSSLEMM
jgi:hypothetical protein